MKQTGLLENTAKSLRKDAFEGKYVANYFSRCQMRQTGLLENTAKSLRKSSLEGKIRCKLHFTGLNETNRFIGKHSKILKENCF